jgi:thymidylate synthase (FAD)
MIDPVYLYDDGIGKVEYVEHMGSDLSVVNSARVSFGKHKQLLDEKDVVTFRFKVPLYVRSQHHRHRTWSYNEISRRYTEYNIEFYNPFDYRTQHKSNRQASNESEFVTGPMAGPILGCQVHESVRRHINLVTNYYEQLLEAGVCREQARGLLPQNMYTEYYGTANLNNILKFVDLRIHEGAQVEIQKVAKAILQITRELYPITVGAYEKAKSS